ncbi:hypothetical protein [Nocardia mexicana]|uniref:Uncharacterized protein n=1 Tax=Nocardia mexicana TaxID=279262 RepID=A0A370HDY4_9NOCA|nr:hypothetical protein [Nocardia mexicana]RDI55447.1 hypothetical protein DFR68_101280 [Nocardia mexicana]
MGQPFQPGPPNQPPPGQGWGPGAPVGQPVPGYPVPPRTGGGAAGPLAAAMLGLSAILYLARRIWFYAEYSKLFWGDLDIVLTVLLAVVGAILLLTGGKPIGRLIAALSAGMLLLGNLGYVLNAIDQSSRSSSLSPWDDGGWLSIPALLVVLLAIVALIMMASSDTGQPSAGRPQQPVAPPNPWPQPPMGQGQPPAGYPGQQPPPQWPQQ